MNLFVGFLVLACLIGSELNGSHPVNNLWETLAAVGLATLLVPGLAFFQTTVLIRKLRVQDFSRAGKQSLCHRMTVCHALVWLSFSLALIWALRWQDVVRGNWQLDRWPLVDEVMILAPVMISMIVSWMIFFDLQTAMIGLKSESAHSIITHPGAPRQQNLFRKTLRQFKLQLDLRPRWAFVSLRFRLYFMMVLVPIGIIVLARDLTVVGSVSLFSAQLSLTPIIAGLSALLLGFPFLILLIWNTGPIEDPRLRSDSIEVCRKYHLRVIGVRRWKTNHQIVNAVVAGLVPYFRVILLSDGLIRHFNRNEVLAVLRHEAGHIRLWHVPTRVVFMLLPIVGFAIRDAWSLPVNGTMVDTLSLVYLTRSPETLGVLLAFVTYGLLVVRWLSHQMEHEADLFSIQPDSSPPKQDGQPNAPTICPNRAQDMKDALLRLAALSPGEHERSTYLHPSIRARIEFIERMESSPCWGRRFQKSFHRRRWILAGLVVLVSGLLVVASHPFS